MAPSSSTRSKSCTEKEGPTTYHGDAYSHNGLGSSYQVACKSKTENRVPVLGELLSTTPSSAKWRIFKRRCLCRKPLHQPDKRTCPLAAARALSGQMLGPPRAQETHRTCAEELLPRGQNGIPLQVLKISSFILELNLVNFGVSCLSELAHAFPR